MKNNIVKIAQKIIRDGQLDPDRVSASWHNLTVIIVQDFACAYLALWYPTSRIPGSLARLEATWTTVRRFDQRWDATPCRSGVSVCGDLRQLTNRKLNDQMMADLVRRMP